MISIIASIYLQQFIGKSMGGKATIEEVMHIYAWSLIPILTLIPLVILEYKMELFDIASILASESFTVIFIVIGIIIANISMGIFSVVLNVIGLSIAHDVSKIRAFIVVLIGTFVTLIPYNYFF